MGVFLCATLTAQERTAQSDTKPMVVVITVDGFPARALNDPRLPMPTLRALAARGAVAAGMQPVNPTVTWPNHTTLITGVDAGQHHVIANGLVEFPAGEGEARVAPWVDKGRLVHARTLYEAAADAGMTTGQVDWVAIYGAKGVDWQFNEVPDATNGISRELIEQGAMTREQLEHFGEGSSPAWRDEIWTDAAVDIVEKHRPNLLLFHLLETDTLQHQLGPLTPTAYAAYAYADACIARVVEAVRKAGALNRTTFFILSDHGFAASTYSIHLNTGLVEQGLLHKNGRSYKGAVLTKAEGGSAHVFIRDASQRQTLVPRLKAYFASLPGVAGVYTNDEARSIGLPSDAESDQGPQLFLVAARGYGFSDGPADSVITEHPTDGQHGYLNTMPEMQALFVASGAGIREGVKLGVISNLRVAPTIAKVLGVQLPDAKQPPLAEVLK